MSNTAKYTDHALHKIALEYCNHPSDMTAIGDEEIYDSSLGGYLGIRYPANITLDLKKVVSIKQISIKFMDPEDYITDKQTNERINLNKTPLYNQCYAFRLLHSLDGHLWSVLYDSTSTQQTHHKGWVWMLLDTHQKMRYFRIHAIHNPANSGFHIVRLRLFDAENPNLQRGTQIHKSKICEYESSDSTSNQTIEPIE